MESILLLGIIGKSGMTMDDLRSPVIPFPPDLPTNTTAPLLTERTLKNCHLSWICRKRNLAARLEALEQANLGGLANCWAGDCSDQHIRALRDAVLEAYWVEERLREAARWCSEREMKPVSMRKLIKDAKSGNRPSHADYPLVLHDLPYPLPEAPASSIYTLTVDRPPPIDLERTDHDRERDAPPTYQAEADVSNGEMSMERGDAVQEYGRSRIQSVGSRLLYGERDAVPTAWG